MAPLHSPSFELSLVNLTRHHLSLRSARQALQAPAGATSWHILDTPKRGQPVVFLQRAGDGAGQEKGGGSSLETLVDASAEQVEVELKLGRFRKCTRLLQTSEGAPWRIWQQRTSRRSYILTVVPRIDPARWMAGLPDSAPLSSLYLPGTHESLAFYGGPISTCQTSRLPIPSQLRLGGIRFLDYRFSLKPNGRLMAYHGIQNEYVEAEQAFEWVYRFLEGEGSGETVIVSVKQENSTPGFEAAMWKLLNKRRELWYRENRWPKLGEVRGRAVMFCRFGFETEQGLHPPNWPNNSPVAFESDIGGQDCIIQDWYSIGSFIRIPEKAALALALFRPPPRPPALSTESSMTAVDVPPTIPAQRRRPLRISFLSGATLITAFPYLVAKGMGYPSVSSYFGFPGVNERVLEGLLARGALGEQSGWGDERGFARGGAVEESGDELRKEAQLGTSTSGSVGVGVEADAEPGEGGMILLSDFWEFPGGLNELLIAWNTTL